MSTKYIIALNTNPSICLGVTTASPGTPVVLSLLQGAGSSLTQWYIDPNSGTIRLAGSAESNPLYLDFQGISPANNNGLIINSLVPGRAFQHWNWVGNPPYVMNVGAPNFCIDDTASTQPGTQVVLFQLSNNINQQWHFVAVPVLEGALAASSH
jgi:hypothetical protein